MQTILEYLKRRDKQDYEPIQIHYAKSGKPDGIEIHDDGHDFILSLKDKGRRMYWSDAVDENGPKGRLGTKEEWGVIDKNLDKINELIRWAGGDAIGYNFYWTLDCKYDMGIWFYDGYRHRFDTTSPIQTLILRQLRDA